MSIKSVLYRKLQFTSNTRKIVLLSPLNSDVYVLVYTRAVKSAIKSIRINYCRDYFILLTFLFRFCNHLQDRKFYTYFNTITLHNSIEI